MTTEAFDREELRSTLRRFAMNELEPWVAEVEKEGEVPQQVMDLLASNGYLGLRIDPKFGGGGMGLATQCLVMEEFSRSHRSFALTSGSSSGLSAVALANHGTPEQQAKYLTGLATGAKLTAFALSEPEAGSDNSAMKTTARKVDGGWVVTGRKHFISGAHRADFILLIAITDTEKRTRGGVSAFVVEKGTPGYEVTRIEQTMASNFVKLCELTFEDCFLPDDALLGSPGQGFAIAMETLAEGRLMVSSSCIGCADRLLEFGIEHAKQRKTFGKPLASRQAIQWMLADSAMELAATRALVYSTIADLEAGKNIGTAASMCKLYASEMVNRVADRVVQIHGGMGLVRSYPIERFYRDVRYFRVGEGASEIQRMIIARGLVGRQAD
jgi:acyl-CoA dehydrogenase